MWNPTILDRLRGPSAVLILATAAAVLCGLFLHPRAFVLAAGTTTALVVGAAWPWLAMRGISGTIAFDRDRAREGEPVEARLVVRNRLPFAAWGLVIRDAGPGMGGGLARARGWGSTDAAWPLTPPCRGEFPGADPRIVSGFPFGLREASHRLAVTGRLLIWPATFLVGPIPKEARGREGDGQASRDRAGTNGDVLGVRPYRRGDSLRRVHWPQSARHGELIVCELHALATPRVQIVVDIHPNAHVGLAPDGTLEWSIRVVASFAEGWSARGAEVELIFGDQRVRSGLGTPKARRARLLDALAQLQPDANFDLGEVLVSADRRGKRDGLRIVVTTDLGMRGLSPQPTRSRGTERFVVLESRGFPDQLGPRDWGPLPISPWIRLDDPDRIPGELRRGGKGVLCG